MKIINNKYAAITQIIDTCFCSNVMTTDGNQLSFLVWYTQHIDYHTKSVYSPCFLLAIDLCNRYERYTLQKWY